MVTNLQTKSSTIKLTDQQIIIGLKEAIDGQLRLFENQFYNRYAGYIYKVAIIKCRNFIDGEDLAKDITQETFIIALNAIKKFSFPQGVPIKEHNNIMKAWLGKIGNTCFLKVYNKRKKEISIEKNTLEIDDVICPICNDILIEDKNLFVCTKGHYKSKKEVQIQAKLLPENFNSFDLFESLYGDSEVEVPNEFRSKLQAAINTIKEEHKHILFTYAAEGCINSNHHLSEYAMSTLCKTFETSPENIRQIKKRTLDKIKKFCFSTNN